jgi:serine/threonine protein phosphatase PrpC
VEAIDRARSAGSTSVASISKYGVPGGGDDAVAEANNDNGEVRGIIVADGIGSHAFAKEGARIAVAAAQEQIRYWTAGSDLFSLFSVVHRQIRSEGKSLYDALDQKPPTEKTCGTTLIVAIEEKFQFQIGYIGNGAILHFRPTFISQSPVRRFTWAAQNYLNPHSQEERGKEALFRYLSLDDNAERALPSVITIGKDPLFGDIVVICTDGVHSADHTIIGVDPDNNVLQTTGAPLVEFYQTLRNCLLTTNGGDIRLPDDLLSKYLSSCFEKRLFDDDASLGMVVSEQALAFVERRSAVAV